MISDPVCKRRRSLIPDAMPVPPCIQTLTPPFKQDLTVKFDMRDWVLAIAPDVIPYLGFRQPYAAAKHLAGYVFVHRA